MVKQADQFNPVGRTDHTHINHRPRYHVRVSHNRRSKIPRVSVSVSATGPAAQTRSNAAHDDPPSRLRIPEHYVMELIADLATSTGPCRTSDAAHRPAPRAARFLTFSVLSNLHARDLIPTCEPASRATLRPRRKMPRPARHAGHAAPPGARRGGRRRPTPSPDRAAGRPDPRQTGKRRRQPRHRSDAILRELEASRRAGPGTNSPDEPEADYCTKQHDDAPATPAKTKALLQWDAAPPTSQHATRTSWTTSPSPRDGAFSDDPPRIRRRRRARSARLG